jgi:hypothetical protein
MINNKLIQEIQLDFNKNKYILIKGFLTPHMANLAYSYCKNVVSRINFMTTYAPTEHRKDWDGDFGDAQANCYGNYGDPLMEVFLISALSEIKLYTGINLVPSYSYWRLYQKHNELIKHIDRHSCEISATLCLGFDASNLQDANYNWPIYVESINGESIPITLDPGDMIIYKGCEIQHWRDKFLGLNHAQVFLHYTDKDGELYNEYDGRPMIAIPKKFAS